MKARPGRTRIARCRSSLDRRRNERGYVAVLAGLLAVPLIGIGALAVDVGQWYVVARETQRAADAGALGGVPYLPGNPTKAFATAQDLVADNGYGTSEEGVTVRTAIDDSPTQLRVTVSRRVPSILGGVFGISGNTITRTAVADYAGPVPLGSPCNRYGNDPDPGETGSSVCDEVGQFWGNVGSPKAAKVSGDAYQNGACASSVDGCDMAKTPQNQDYDANGFFYSITLEHDVPNLVIEAFDPALVHVGDLCKDGNLSAAKKLGAKALVSDPATRYAEGQSASYCTGDINFKSSDAAYKLYANQVGTNFTIRDPGPNPWDPLSFPAHEGCTGTGTYPGWTGDLNTVLDTTNTAVYTSKPSGSGLAPVATTDGYVAKVFRRWVPLCTIPVAKAGTYLVQIKTNGVGFDSGNGHNRFSLRAYSATQTSAKDAIAISGFSRMTMYANLPNAETSFYLARVPSGAAGQILNVSLFDVGDSTTPGRIRVVAPPKSGVAFTDCRTSGVNNASLPTCQLEGVNSKYNGKWQKISVPIPLGYRCNDLDATDCWVRLEYSYGSGNQPSDTTSWAASIEGDPVRLIE